MVSLQTKAGQDPPRNPNDVDKKPPGFGAVHAWGCRDRDDPEIREGCLKGFQQHKEKVLRTIPKERLLVFNLSDGWRPLCGFLGKPVPDEAFPGTCGPVQVAPNGDTHHRGSPRAASC